MSDAQGQEPATGTAVATAAETGKRMRRAFMPRLFATPEDIMKDCVGKGKGTRFLYGRLIGVVVGHARKSNTLPDGSPSVSIVLNGSFESENAKTGEVGVYSQAYLPMAFAEHVETVFQANPDAKSVQMDLDIGVEATGKTIPYEWTITSHINDESQDLLKMLRNQRRPGQRAQLIAGPSGAAPKQIENAQTIDATVEHPATDTEAAQTTADEKGAGKGKRNAA